MLDETSATAKTGAPTGATILPRSVGEAAMWACAGYGLFFAACPDLARSFPFDLMFYGGERPVGLSDAEADRALDFYAALLGALTFAWTFTTALMLRSGERWAWNAALIGVAAWFAVDTAASVATGFWQNGVTNAGFAALLAGALLLSRPARS